MSSDEIAGVIRAILSALGGVLVAKGYLDNATMTAVVGALVTIAVAGWSIYAKKAAKAAAPSA
jgi:hypothetical protein